jgi:hypothetical protein
VDHYSIGWGLSLPHEVSRWFRERKLSIDLTAQIHRGRYVCTSLDVTSLAGAGITGESLRELRIAEWIRTAARNPTCEDKLGTAGRKIVEDADGPTSEALEVVATTYRYGHAIGDQPTRTAMDLLDLPRSRAARWIALARDQGLLEGTTRGVPGGVVLSDEQLAQQRLPSLRSSEQDLQFRIKELQSQILYNQGKAQSARGTLRTFLNDQVEGFRRALDHELELLEEVQEAIEELHRDEDHKAR